MSTPERLPRERLLEDPLAQVAGEEQAFGRSRQRSQEAQVRDADILRLVDHDIVERGVLALRQVGGQRLNRPSR
jgi:hypothetical protein